MKKTILSSVVLSTMVFSTASFALIGGKAPCEETERFEKPSPGIGMGSCIVASATTSLPTTIISDQKIDQSSPEYKALAIDQAVRTIDGERTLIFGNDTKKAVMFLNSL